MQLKQRYMLAETLDIWYNQATDDFRLESKNNNKNLSLTKLLKLLRRHYGISTADSLQFALFVVVNRKKRIDYKRAKV